MVIRLGGSWQIDDGLPPAAQVERELGAGTVRRVAFDVRTLESWDSAIVALVARVSQLCRERNIALSLDDLPAGVRRLLGLAEAVPEKAGARRIAGHAGLGARLGRAPAQG